MCRTIPRIRKRGGKQNDNMVRIPVYRAAAALTFKYHVVDIQDRLPNKVLHYEIVTNPASAHRPTANESSKGHR